jgi:hypothetical protein
VMDTDVSSSCCAPWRGQTGFRSEQKFIACAQFWRGLKILISLVILFSLVTSPFTFDAQEKFIKMINK